MIRMDSNVDLYIERRTSSRQIEPRAENSQPTQNTETGHGRRASARARGLKFATTGFAEVAQWIHLLDQCRQVDECPVGGKIGFDDQLSRLLGRFNHSIACKDFHPSYECIQVNELHNFRILASEGIDVKPRCFFNKALVELFAGWLAVRGGHDPCGAELSGRENSRHGSGRRSRKGCKGGYVQQVHFIFLSCWLAWTSFTPSQLPRLHELVASIPGAALPIPQSLQPLNDDFLIETAEEGLLAPSGPRGRRKPIGDLVAP